MITVAYIVVAVTLQLIVIGAAMNMEEHQNTPKGNRATLMVFLVSLLVVVLAAAAGHHIS